MQDGIEGYRFDVPQGRYELEFLFTDTHQKQAQSIYLLGKDKEQSGAATRKGGFDIEVNGKRVETDFVPGAEVGYFTALRRRYLVEADKAGLQVKFISKDGKAFLSGIKIRRI